MNETLPAAYFSQIKRKRRPLVQFEDPPVLTPAKQEEVETDEVKEQPVEIVNEAVQEVEPITEIQPVEVAEELPATEEPKKKRQRRQKTE